MALNWQAQRTISQRSRRSRQEAKGNKHSFFQTMAPHRVVLQPVDFSLLELLHRYNLNEFQLFLNTKQGTAFRAIFGCFVCLNSRIETRKKYSFFVVGYSLLLCHHPNSRKYSVDVVRLVVILLWPFFCRCCYVCTVPPP